MIPTIVLLFIILACVGVSVTIYNGFVSLRNRCEEAYSSMDVYLKKRWDLVPNLVESVKGYAAHEKETLESVINARNMALQSSDMPSLQQNENALAAGLKNIFALSEAYPDLKANQNFINLQNQLTDVENDIMQARKYYNAVVKTLNTKREMFPHSIIAGMLNIKKRDYFEIEETERANIKVSF